MNKKLYHFSKLFCRQVIYNNPVVEQEIERVSGDFYNTYGGELDNMQVCAYLTEVMAKTELDSFNFLFNNC